MHHVIPVSRPAKQRKSYSSDIRNMDPMEWLAELAIQDDSFYRFASIDRSEYSVLLLFDRNNSNVADGRGRKFRNICIVKKSVWKNKIIFLLIPLARTACPILNNESIPAHRGLFPGQKPPSHPTISLQPYRRC